MSTPAISVALAGSRGDFRLDVAFEAPMRGITALFGPSGSGKTTVLRCLAGLDRLPGRLTIGDDTWQDSATSTFLPPHRRNVGYVFQEPSLFAHLSVRDNLLYGARRAGPADALAGLDLAAVVDLVGIGHLLGRSALALSGGERQRVAVGRALLASPRVLLMDEPLSALDRVSREEILPTFERLHEALDLPVIYVSHDFSEIERLADWLVLLERGRVVASGPLAALQTDPALPLLAASDASVVLEGKVEDVDADFGLTRFAIAGGELVAPGRHGDAGVVRRLRIQSSDVSLALTAPTGSTILNCLPARIVSIESRAQEPQASVVLGLGASGEGCRIVARITRKSLHALALSPGASVVAQIKGVAVVASRAGR